MAKRDKQKLYVGVESVVYPDGEKLIDVAKWNEYGTQLIPPRPAFRMGLEAAVEKRKKLVEATMANVARDLLTQKGNGQKLIDKRLLNMLVGIGQSAKAETKRIIKAGETVANAPATVKKKGFDHPLYNTGTLLENVSYVVEKK